MTVPENEHPFTEEAGYQAQLLMPCLRFKFYLQYAVTKHPWLQVPAGQIGVVIAQIGDALPIGAKSAIYTPRFGTFTDLRAFVEGVEGKAGGPRIKGQKGVQRPVLPPGTLAPIHPVAFLVITKPQVYGIPISQELRRSMKGGSLTYQAWDQLREEHLDVARIEPKATEGGRVIDMVGVVTALEGESLPAGDIASRLGGFEDIKAIEFESKRGEGVAVQINNSRLIETILGSKNDQHNSYQDFQTFLDKGGKIGLQHDPRIYQAEIVPTAILKLDWSKGITGAHRLDERLEPIVAKSREGFVFTIDLQVLIHVPDTKAPRVISMVGSMLNLVNEVLQAAVGNLFRDKLGGMPAVTFIETRQTVQQEAMAHISKQLSLYEVETKGVYIQDVILPQALVQVLT